MKTDVLKKKELLGFIWGVVGLLIMLLVGCATPRNTDTDTQVDYSNNFGQMQNRMDSLLYNMKLIQRETSERLSNLKIENTTTYLSAPDSTGKQYPTAISETKANKEDKENKITETNIEATMQQLITEVNELKQQLDTTMSAKEKVKEVSWWQLHKVDVYAVVLTVLTVVYIICRMRKKILPLSS